MNFIFSKSLNSGFVLALLLLSSLPAVSMNQTDEEIEKINRQFHQLADERNEQKVTEKLNYEDSYKKVVGMIQKRLENYDKYLDILSRKQEILKKQAENANKIGEILKTEKKERLKFQEKLEQVNQPLLNPTIVYSNSEINALPFREYYGNNPLLKAVIIENKK